MSSIAFSSTFSGPFRSQPYSDKRKCLKLPIGAYYHSEKSTPKAQKRIDKGFNQAINKEDSQLANESRIQNNPTDYVFQVKTSSEISKVSPSESKRKAKNLSMGMNNKKPGSRFVKQNSINTLPESPIANKKKIVINGINGLQASITNIKQKVSTIKTLQSVDLSKDIPESTTTTTSRPPKKSLLSPKTMRNNLLDTDSTSIGSEIISKPIKCTIEYESNNCTNEKNSTAVTELPQNGLDQDHTLNEIDTIPLRRYEKCYSASRYAKQNEIKKLTTESSSLSTMTILHLIQKQEGSTTKSIRSPTNKIFNTASDYVVKSLDISTKVSISNSPMSQSSSSSIKRRHSNVMFNKGEGPLSYPKQLFENIFQWQACKRIKCSCEPDLDQEATCHRANYWMMLRYTENDIEYLKETYNKLLEIDLKNTECSIQIQKDISRTFPDNKYFSCQGQGLTALERVLNTFAKYEPQIGELICMLLLIGFLFTIGYVQGMNFIAASLLYHAEEYLAFWLLVLIFEKFEMRDIYLPKLPGLSKHCQMIGILIGNYIPDLYAHLCKYDIRVEMFCAEWIFALFSSVIPIENMGMLYDNMLIQGWPYFYKLILAFLIDVKKQILSQTDFASIFAILKGQDHIAAHAGKYQKNTHIEWNELFKKALKLEIDDDFIYKMHSNYDNDTQQYKIKLQYAKSLI